ncbi:sialate O-acetylesterase [Caldicellulosiruptor morganii]|uniref:Sialate O-acetylesterase n=1 Tax=Caldicellulosiruptor morganii TaxID=1387555 RepID=A0ABY7BLM4_9FIRM|nr:sialate O-acetylesterase [Caldicellulosiruptor morganii]WAM33743.1 sialate O-acetylesterase [Caldicellulosiruptor morganii]
MPLVLPKLLSDGMVLQRNSNIKIWGWANAGETVEVNFLGKSYTARPSDEGSWEVILPPMDAGGPYCMEIKCAHHTTVIKDILIGDVWVCSGQSNMVLPMERVIDLYPEELEDCNIPFIRQFTVPDRYHFKGPLKDLEGGCWEVLGKETILKFSAVGYFFAKALYKKYKIPIGLIKACVGGTPIEAWMSKEIAVQFIENPEELEKLKDDSFIESVKKEEEAKIKAWFDYLENNDIGLKNTPFPFFDENYIPSGWKPVNIPATWKQMGLDSTIGAVWFRKEVNIPSRVAGKPAKLYLGTIVDSDFTYVNGVLVGSTSYRYPPRKYNIPAGLLKEGKNTIVVRVISNDGNGEFVKGKEYKLFTEDYTQDLSGQWLCTVGARAKEPLPLQTFFQYKPTGLFNGMIAPLLNYSIKGIIWYQGESNTDNPEGYCEKLCAFVKDLRERWKNNFPFLYVQLANFMEPKPQPGDSNWARLREEQRRALLRLDNAGMAVAIDVGEWNDLHPSNKKAVGERLALLAQKIAYGEKDLVASGPLYRSMKIEGNRVILEFSDAGSGLCTKDGKMPKSFAIAGPDKNFVWANAKIYGSKVIVWNDSIQNPVYVRYAWADNPEGANLYNKEGLPASPFTTEEEL